MKLYAISDLHLRHERNRQALEQLALYPEDWLILAGDIGETLDHLGFAFEHCVRRFKQVIWVPGNHELWTSRSTPIEERGQAKYEQLVALARSWGVLTPEDPYPLYTGEGGPCMIAPLFVLYDYSFRPAHVSRRDAVGWASETGIVCTDEALLDSHPYPSRDAWCHARVSFSERRLSEAARRHPLVLVNHFPLRQDLIRIPRVPRFCIWCGTTLTEHWHRQFRAKVVVSGHLHVRRTDWIDGVRFEEVSLGYPRQWRSDLNLDHYLREILPGPAAPATASPATRYHH